MVGLSQWLADPVTITGDLDDTSACRSVQETCLDPRLQASLKSQGIERLFPVQEAIMNYLHSQSDLCVRAPTGSGKTLAYILPMLQSLRTRRVTRLRALILVPGRELATQVLCVLERLAASLDLHAAVIMGQTSISAEAKRLVNHLTGQSLVDILIATPGRLLDHLENTKGFTLQHIEWLVLDEADRLLEGFTQEWLPSLLASFSCKDADASGAISYRLAEDVPFDSSTCWMTPLKKLLFSATLTRNPAKFMELCLRDPVYICVAGAGKDGPKHSTPKDLQEYMYICEEERKPVPLVYFLQNGLVRSLCFTKSVRTTKKLSILLAAACPERQIASFSANLTGVERAEILSRFDAGSLDLLICSDAAARGLDLQDVRAVINYDAPKHMKTYIHRVGRTARAGRSGKAYTIVGIKEAHHFKEMIANSGKNKLHTLRIPKSSMQTICPCLDEALAKLTANSK